MNSLISLSIFHGADWREVSCPSIHVRVIYQMYSIFYQQGTYWFLFTILMSLFKIQHKEKNDCFVVWRTFSFYNNFACFSAIHTENLNWIKSCMFSFLQVSIVTLIIVSVFPSRFSANLWKEVSILEIWHKDHNLRNRKKDCV